MELPFELKQAVFEKRIYLAVSHTFSADISYINNKQYQIVHTANFFHFYNIDWFVLYWAIRTKKLELFYWLYKNHPNLFHDKILEVVVKSGTVEMARFLIDKGYKCYTRGMEWAGERGDIAMIHMLYQHFPEKATSNVLYEAAKKGHLPVIQWFHNRGRNDLFTAIVMDLAAESGHLDMIKWLHVNRSEGCTTGAMSAATLGGHYHIVKWLKENRHEGWTDWAITLAAINGNLSIINLLAEKRDYPDAIRFAREHTGERREILKFLENLKK